jgi:hypothetical protein
VVELSRPVESIHGAMHSWLDQALLASELRPEDHVAADEVDLLHTRTLRDGRGRIEVERPLRALASLARTLS